MDSLDQLSSVSRSGTLTVAGITTAPATSVTVSGVGAALYGDNTFAKDNVTVRTGTTVLTAVAQDGLGGVDTNRTSVTLPNSVSFRYDLNGNLTFDGNRHFTYDALNRLASVYVDSAWKTEFVYDGQDRLRIRREYLWQTSAWVGNGETRYVYDGSLVIQERDANNLPTVTYTRGWDLSGTCRDAAGGIGGLLARTDNSTFPVSPSTATAYYHADGNGNVTMLIDGNQLPVAKYLYSPFGNIIAQSGAFVHNGPVNAFDPFGNGTIALPQLTREYLEALGSN
jgi:YD repeat-containing protein